MTRNGGGFQPTWRWNAGLSAFWFAQSYKWFIVYLTIGPAAVAALVPADQKNAAWGLTVSIGAAWATIGPALFGEWSDRIGRRKPFIVIGVALTVVALAFFVSAQSVWMLTLAYLVLQIADDVGTGPYGGVIPQYVPLEHRGLASGVLSQLQLVAQIMSAVVGLWLRQPILIIIGIALVNIAGAAITLGTLRNLPEPEPQPASEPFLKGWLGTWRNIHFRRVFLVKLLASVGMYLVQNYLLNLITDLYQKNEQGGLNLFGLNIPVAQGPTLIGLGIVLFGAVGASWAMKRVDRLGLTRVMRWAAGTVVLVLLCFAFVRTLEVAAPLAVFFGLSLGTYMSAEWGLAADAMPNPKRLNRDMGLWTSAVTAGQLLVGGVGPIIDRLNKIQMGYGYMTMIFISAGLFVAAGVVIGRIERPSRDSMTPA